MAMIPLLAETHNAVFINLPYINIHTDRYRYERLMAVYF